MNPAAIIQGARSDGVDLRLTDAGTIKASGDQAAVSRWLAAIREHKPEIIALLKGSPATTSRGWTVTYPSGQQVETFILLADGTCPTRAQVLMDYVGACDAEPIPEAEQ